jgi:23S rRNA C2498 (ribose-2'-O)-methylase RlmM
MTNSAHAHRILDTQSYKNTLTVCNINAFLLKICFHELASMLRYKHIACLVLLPLFAVGRQMLVVLCGEGLSSEQTSVEIALCTIKSVIINKVRSSIRMEEAFITHKEPDQSRRNGNN